MKYITITINAHKILTQDRKGMPHLEGLGIDRKLKLKCILKREM
jgi:hypothetical protein